MSKVWVVTNEYGTYAGEVASRIVGVTSDLDAAKNLALEDVELYHSAYLNWHSDWQDSGEDTAKRVVGRGYDRSIGAQLERGGYYLEQYDVQ